VVTSVDGWVWDYNVDLFMSQLAHAIGYSYDDLDQGAVEAGLLHTDVAEGAWFDHPLVDQHQLVVYLATSGGHRPVNLSGSRRHRGRAESTRREHRLRVGVRERRHAPNC